jgi:hypothetical protein
MVFVCTTVAVLAGAVVSGALSRLGQDGNAVASGRPLGAGEVQRALHQAQAPLSTAPTETSPPRGQAMSRTRSWQVVGGTIAASCRGGAAELSYAAPIDGWAYQLGAGAPGILVVAFTRPGAVSRVVVKCAGGEPRRVAHVVHPTQPAQPVDGGGGEDSGD